jgi:hypothetical protein
MAPDMDLFDAFRRTFDRVRPEPQKQLLLTLQDPNRWADVARAVDAVRRVAADAGPHIAEGRGVATVTESTPGTVQASRPGSATMLLLFLPVCILVATSAQPVIVVVLAAPLFAAGLWPLLRGRAS